MTQIVQAPGNRPQKLSVRVKRNADGICQVTSTHPLPSTQAVLKHLCKSDQATLRSTIGGSISFTSLVDSLRLCTDIKASAWVKAITKATAEVLADHETARAELSVVKGPAYLSMGDCLFQLEATDFILSGEKALPALRKRITADAEEEAISIREAAQAQAASLTVAARREAGNLEIQAARSRQELTNLRNQAAQLGVIPAWVRAANLAVRWAPESLYNSQPCFFVLSTLTLTITHFACTIAKLVQGQYQHFKRIWKARNHKPLLVPIELGLGLTDGQWEASTTRLSPLASDILGGSLPHLDFARACFQIGDAPHAITNLQQLNTVLRGIERTMQEINLDSPLSTWSGWAPAIQRKAPPALAALLSSTNQGSTFASIECSEEQPLANPLTLTIPREEPPNAPTSAPPTSTPDDPSISFTLYDEP